MKRPDIEGMKRQTEECCGRHTPMFCEEWACMDIIKLINYIEYLESNASQPSTGGDQAIMCGCHGYYQLFGVHRIGCAYAFDPPGPSV